MERIRKTDAAFPTIDLQTVVPANSHFIAGRWTEGHAEETIDVLNPATQELLQRVPRGGASDIDRAVNAAHAAFPQWRDMHPTRRGDLLRNWATVLERHAEELSLIESLEGGQPYRAGEGAGITRRLRYYAAQTDKIAGLTVPTVSPDVLAFTLREPYGVCGIIIPWNSPIGMMLNGGAAALAAGNTIVVKPSEEAPLVSLFAASLTKEAGLPDGVVNVVAGLGTEAGAAIPIHELVRHVSFTGSPETGERVMADCARNHIPVVLELGGKSPMILFDDADLADAVPVITGSITDNAGQVCYAGTRLVVDEAIRRDVVDAIATALRGIRVGPWYEDTDMGPVISEKQRDRVIRYINLGVEEGARLVTGGRKVTSGSCAGGFFIEPTLFDGVDMSMRISQEEIFGPVLAVQGFSGIDEALEIANGTRYGLVASIWTRDIRRAQWFARRVQAGQVYVNTHGHRGAIGAPFGGYKNSGFGRSGGIETIFEYLQVKTVIMDGRGFPE